MFQKYDSLRYFLKLSYHGKPFHGWQRQPNAVTVQQTIEEALSTILRNEIAIVGAGRTDAGVHASEMYAHFDIPVDAVHLDLTMLRNKLNGFLPQAIAIQDILEVHDEAHTRFDATDRSYVYRIAKQKNPFTTVAAYHFKLPLALEAMNEAAKKLLNYRDFECFSKSNTDVKTYLCDVREAVWLETEDEYHFHITADRFLRNMVRAIVGTLLEIGIGKKEVTWMDEVIASKSRRLAGASAPAHGLYLTKVEYPLSIFK